MNRSHLRRVLGLTVTAMLLLAALGALPASAKTPNWSITYDRLPVTVAPDRDAGYFVTVKNNDTATINNAKLTVTPASTPDATPTYFSGLDWSAGGPEVGCTTTGQLICDLGTMASGDTFTFTVAYDVSAYSAGKFAVTFFLEAATGNVGGKNNSRGDALTVTASTNVNASQNFDGGFVVGDTQYATTGSLGRNNKQSSHVDLAQASSLLTVNVEDGITDNLCDTSDDSHCANQIGEWTRLNVPGSSGYLKVTLNVWGGSVPGGTQPGDIFLIHVLDNGTVEIIGDTASERCADPNSAPTSGECVYVTKVGSNYRMVAWLLKNGTLRGGI